MELQALLAKLKELDLPELDLPRLVPTDRDLVDGGANNLIAFWVQRLQQKVEELDNVYAYVAADELLPNWNRNQNQNRSASELKSTQLLDETPQDDIKKPEQSPKSSIGEGDCEESFKLREDTNQEEGDLLEPLVNTQVVIYGLDGVGAMLAQRFVSLGVKSLTLVDGDKVDTADVYGLFYWHSHLGRNRTECVANVIENLRLGVQIKQLSNVESARQLELDAKQDAVLVSAVELPKNLRDEFADNQRLIVVNPAAIVAKCFDGEMASWKETMEVAPWQSCCVSATLTYVCGRVNKQNGESENEGTDDTASADPTSVCQELLSED